MIKNNIIVRNPKNSFEVNLGFNIAKKIFKNDKHLLLVNKFYAHRNKKNINLAIDLRNNEILGFSINIVKLIKINNKNVKCGFISSICIKKQYRGYGISKILIDQSNKNLLKKNVLFSVVIARKKLDYFYNKFNFWGVSTFPEIKLNSLKSKKNFQHGIIFKEVKNDDIEKINSMYKFTYKKINGLVLRKKNDWKFIIKKCENEKIKFLKVIFMKKLIGYVVLKKNQIFEISCKTQLDYSNTIDALIKKFKFRTLLIFTNNKHSINDILLNYKYKLKYRFVPEGGHMVKILNISTFKNIYKFQKNINNLKKLTLSFFNSDFKFNKNISKRYAELFYFNYLDQI